MNRVKIWIWHVSALDPVVGQQTNIPVAHQRLAQRLDTMFQVAFDDPFQSTGERALVLIVIISVDVLAQ